MKAASRRAPRCARAGGREVEGGGRGGNGGRHGGLQRQGQATDARDASTGLRANRGTAKRAPCGADPHALLCVQRHDSFGAVTCQALYCMSRSAAPRPPRPARTKVATTGPAKKSVRTRAPSRAAEPRDRGQDGDASHESPVARGAGRARAQPARAPRHDAQGGGAGGRRLRAPPGQPGVRRRQRVDPGPAAGGAGAAVLAGRTARRRHHVVARMAADPRAARARARRRPAARAHRAGRAVRRAAATRRRAAGASR